MRHIGIALLFLLVGFPADVRARGPLPAGEAARAAYTLVGNVFNVEMPCDQQAVILSTWWPKTGYTDNASDTFWLCAQASDDLTGRYLCAQPEADTLPAALIHDKDARAFVADGCNLVKSDVTIAGELGVLGWSPLEAHLAIGYSDALRPRFWEDETRLSHRYHFYYLPG